MAVSPIPRAIARISAVASPARALGSTTFQIVFHWVAPSALLASRRPPGTTRSATSPARAMIGTMVTAIATATARPDFGQPKPTIEHHVDEQAGQDLGQRRHRLDDGPHRAASSRPPTSVM